MVQQAKVLSSSLGARQLSTEATSIKELRDDEPNDVVFESKYGLRTVMLNRPKKLNSLNASMIRKIVPRLVEWEKSDLANVVVMKGAGEKSLCAGGDVAALAHLNQQEDGWKKSAEYFALEYKLDHYIATYQKPYIAFMDGITMGGGVGLSAHAPFRIATEKTVFAMPETTIGFFPDARLAELRFRDSDDLPARLALINETLEEFCTGLPYDQPMALSGEIRRAIDRCFNKNTISDIIAALESERGATEEWAQKQIKTLHKRSPTAVHVALRQMRVGGEWDIAETFKKEHQISSKFMQHPDFTEGVTALLIRKETPKWSPESLEDIATKDNVTKPFFEFDPKSDIELFTDRTYSEYPHQSLGVPTEKEIRKVLSDGSYSQEELANIIIASRRGRQGISEVVKEIIARKTDVDARGKARWLADESTPGSKL
ncbi:hypothetical protein MRS44_012483 [Fusarium solani]|uniref:uncharacterized protein n=1 Tax=Fusarium solani TaxID=169388 RepID=UPI0032C4378C|nr:hypothetical protein MRS44_012483 [Fusarium solani]